MKRIILIFATLIFALYSCNKTNLEGNWIETNNFKTPVLIQFYGELCNHRNLSKSSDSVRYKVFWNQITFQNQDTTLVYKYDFNNDTLILLSDDKSYRLAKSERKCFVDDLLEQLPIEINMPEGNGSLNTLDWAYGIIYLGYEKENQQLELYFNGEKLDSISGMGYKMLACIKEEIDYPRYRTIIFADKNVPYSVIKEIQDEHRKAGLYKLNYSFNSIYMNNFQNYSCIANRIFAGYHTYPLYLDSFDLYPPRPPDRLPFLSIEYEIPLIQLIDTSILFDGRQIVFQDLHKKMRSEIKRTHNKTVFLYKVDPNVKYGQFIKFLDMAFQTFFEFREEYSRNIYGKPYYILSDSLSDEVKDKIPISIFEVDSVLLSIINSRGHGWID
ncbi:MAG: hypothetical protein P1P88_15430 [Bacteroidales bacterium]|nr:hypothetical protein [Bacteroidales bacterium]